MSLCLDRGPKYRYSEAPGIASHTLVARHQSHHRPKFTRMLLQDAQVERLKIHLFPRRPDEEDPRRFCPRHPITDGNQVVVRGKCDDLCLHRNEL